MPGPGVRNPSPGVRDYPEMHPVLGSYEKFRSSVGFGDMRARLRQQQARGERRHITRATVLGAWHEWKVREWLAMIEWAEAEVEDLLSVSF